MDRLKFKQIEDGSWVGYRDSDVEPIQEKQPQPDEPYKRRKIVKEPDEQQGNE